MDEAAAEDGVEVPDPHSIAAIGPVDIALAQAFIGKLLFAVAIGLEAHAGASHAEAVLEIELVIQILAVGGLAVRIVAHLGLEQIGTRELSVRELRQR